MFRSSKRVLTLAPRHIRKFYKKFQQTAKILLPKLSVVPNAMITMYGIKVIRNIMAADTDPMLADEKNDDVI